MKSERRHKLQENALAHSLENLPKMGKESGSKLLLGIVTVLLIIVLIRYYLMSRESKREAIAADLTDARYWLADLNGGNSIEHQMEMSTGRKKALDELEKKVDAVEAETTDVALVAQAKNIRADAYVRVAAVDAATTRPDLALPRPPEELLDQAARAYQEVLDMKEGLPVSEAADAHFGLGAIAEDRREWDKARSQYDAVAKDPSMPKAFTDYAALRLTVLDKISKPFVVGKAMPMPTTTTSPSTAPSPTTGSASPELPATSPAAPTSVPVAPTTEPVIPTSSPSLPASAPSTQASINEGHFGTKDDLFYQ